MEYFKDSYLKNQTEDPNIKAFKIFKRNVRIIQNHQQNMEENDDTLIEEQNQI